MSHNYPPLARIGLGIEYDRKLLKRRSDNLPLKVNYDFDNCVMTLYLHPGMNATMLRYFLATDGLKGVVMRSYGAGNCPSSPWFIETIAEAVKRGILILNVSQCASGSVSASRYLSADMLTKAGVISGHDITYEAAIAKMMYLFGQDYTREQIRHLLSVSIAGEMTV